MKHNAEHVILDCQVVPVKVWELNLEAGQPFRNTGIRNEFVELSNQQFHACLAFVTVIQVIYKRVQQT